MDRAEKLAERFLRIAKTLPDELLMGEPDLEAEVFGQLTRQDDRLLGFYSAEGVRLGLERYGILDTLRGRGYARFEVEFRLEDTAHTLLLVGDGERLCEARLRRTRGVADPCMAEYERHFLPELLVVEWLWLVDPRAAFSEDRPPLPGQTHPGTGIGAEIFVLLYLVARRLGLHGLVEIPERFHNAVMYRRRTHFVDPVYEGHFQALCRLLQRHPLAEVAWGLEEGRVLDGPSGAPIRWLPREQLLPLDRRVGRYFEEPAWRHACALATAELRPVLLPRPAE